MSLTKTHGISIIIPTFNSEKTLNLCLSSFLNLDYKKFEIIIVDNNSNDKTFEIIKKNMKKSKRIKFFKLNNVGISAARNFGVKKAKYGIVLFTDDDCIVDKDLLIKINKKFNENKDVAIISGAKKPWNIKSDLARFIGYELEIIYRMVSENGLIYSGAFLCACKKFVFKKVRFYEKIKKPSIEPRKFIWDASRFYKTFFDINLRIWHVNLERISSFYKRTFEKHYGKFCYRKKFPENKHDSITAIFFTSLIDPLSIFFVVKKENWLFYLKALMYIFVEDAAKFSAFLHFFYDYLNGDYKNF
jgi:glycosyltransferase involved in cell wall biosynthesis